MCLFTCQKCKSTINQRETTNHECEPRADDAPTDAEVEAAARALNLRGWTCFWGAHEPGEFDQCEQCQSECRSLARAALTAAKEDR